MKNHSRSIDEQIRQAIQKGEFDNLPGKGQPLDLSENPFEDPSWRIAFRMLRQSGYTLPWLETRQTIEKDYQEACLSLERSWNWRNEKIAAGEKHRFVENEWRRALAQFQEKVIDLNRRIFNYNLEVPADQFQRRQINSEREIEKITSG